MDNEVAFARPEGDLITTILGFRVFPLGEIPLVLSSLRELD